jgi:hypothetical protein
MKKILCITSFAMLFLIGTNSLLMAQQKNQKGAVLSFEKEREDLGTMYVDELKQTNMKIKFTNEGDQPLVLSQVRGCCGTRIVDWPRTPVLPGEEGIINISYRLASRAHKVSRTVTVTSNNSSGTLHYRIVGEVIERSTQQLNPAKSDLMDNKSNTDKQ